MRVEVEDSAGTIAGYRLVRRLATGDRSAVYLARAEPAHMLEEPSQAIGEAAGKLSGSVALKVFARGTQPAQIDAELGALSTVTHPHLLRLIDVATAPDGLPCLIMERINGPTLARILGAVTALEPGEATTILAPVCGALQTLHAAGFAHGFVTASKIMIDAGGAPVLVGFGRAAARRAVEGEDPDWRDAVLADQRSLLQLCRSICDSSGGLELAEQLGHGAVESFLPSLERWLFEQAAPVPLRRAELGLGVLPNLLSGVDPFGVQARAVAGVAIGAASDWPEPAVPEEARDVGPTALADILRMLPLPEWVHRVVAPVKQGEPARISAISRSIRGKRRPVVLGLVILVGIVAGVLVLFPSEGPDAGGAGAQVRQGQLGEQAPGDVGPLEWTESSDAAAAVLADDPAMALGALSARRDRCLLAKSVDCLAEVHQWQSASGAADRFLLSSVPEGETPQFLSFDTSRVTTLERTGDSAIVAASGADDEPASFLLMKGEAGWRLRDVFYR